ncbi:MAG: hypothetical protein O2816_01720, partial [Planctomycetota bacterium]|nr:hypothetical protein [Planctomycetota bacterium]
MRLHTLCATAVASLSLVPLSLAQDTAPYRELDEIHGAWVDLMTAPVRPMAWNPVTGSLWAVNSHDSTVLEWSADGTPLQTARVPWGPVAIAHHAGDDDGPGSMLVVCRNTASLVRIDASTGTVLDLIPLGTEPADLVVQPSTGHAFVALAGLRMVVEIDVDAGEVVERYPVPSLRPTFLSLDGDDVLVSPMVSGNNSTSATGKNALDPGPGRVLDLEDPTIADTGLPDHDLFRIAGGEILPVARDLGAVLFAAGRHPVTGQFWQLGTEANNKNKHLPGEPAIRGDIVVNQVAIMSLAQGAIVEPLVVIDLDDQDPGTPGVQYDAQKSVGQPCAIAFGAGGEVYVAGLLTDNVVELDGAGSLVREWDVADTPRGLLLNGAGTELLVYGWQTNEIQRFDLTQAAPTLVGTLDVGFDPTPAVRREGRRVFYDASHSLHGNASCATCHVETDSDLLSWDLSNLPYDDKGPLVTQFMRGIEDLAPFHWRGERAELIDFNPAFDGLLGGAPLDQAEFNAFQEYLFSLEQPANPNQDQRRVVVNRGSFRRPSDIEVSANAIAGQNDYFDTTVIQGVGSCNACHTLPTGTSNEIFFDEPNLDFAPRTHFVVASYNGMWRKEQATFERIQLRDGTVETRPTIGAGLSATGLKDDLLDFANIDLFTAPQQVRSNITAFLHQTDSGLAPAIHKGFLLNADNTAATVDQVRNYLLAQAIVDNCDVVLFGEVAVAGTPRNLRWWWDRDMGLFRCEDGTVADQTLAFFTEQAAAGTANVIVQGLPIGMGERFAVDFDLDGLYNHDELALGTDPLEPDTDNDGDFDGHEVDNGGDPNDPGVGSDDQVAPTISAVELVFVTNTVAKIQFRTDELCRFDATWDQGNKSGSDASELFERRHTVIFTDLRPNGLTHGVTLTAVDLGGNTTATNLQVTTLPNVDFASVVLRSATATEVQDSAGTLSYQFAGKARAKGGGLQSGRRLRVNVFVNGVLTQALLQGTLSAGDGATSVVVTEDGLVPGDLVTVVVFDLLDAGPNFGGD